MPVDRSNAGFWYTRLVSAPMQAIGLPLRAMKLAKSRPVRVSAVDDSPGLLPMLVAQPEAEGFSRRTAAPYADAWQKAPERRRGASRSHCAWLYCQLR